MLTPRGSVFELLGAQVAFVAFCSRRPLSVTPLLAGGGSRVMAPSFEMFHPDVTSQAGPALEHLWTEGAVVCLEEISAGTHLDVREKLDVSLGDLPGMRDADVLSEASRVTEAIQAEVAVVNGLSDAL